MNTADRIMAHVQHACATFKPNSLRVHDDVMTSLREEIEELVRDSERLNHLDNFLEKYGFQEMTVREAIDSAMRKEQS